MAKHLNAKVDEMSYDNLISGLTPQVLVASGIIAATSADTIYARGSVFAKSATDGKLYLLGSEPASGDTLIPDCILCDDETVTAGADATVAVYVAGNFNIDAITLADGYTITEADKDKLRERNIYFAQLFE